MDPRGFSEGEKAAWEANMHAIHAEEVLRERGGSLSPDALYAATLAATGDRAAAAKAAARRHLDLS